MEEKPHRQEPRARHTERLGVIVWTEHSGKQMARQRRGATARRKYPQQPARKTMCTWAARPVEGPAPRGEHGQGLGHAGRGEPALQGGEVAEEEIHGCLEAAERPHLGADGRVPGHREQMHDREEQAPGSPAG